MTREFRRFVWLSAIRKSVLAPFRDISLSLFAISGGGIGGNGFLVKYDLVATPWLRVESTKQFLECFGFVCPSKEFGQVKRGGLMHVD